MCKWIKSGDNRIDPCMRSLIELLKIGGAVPLACCCGHGRYSKTVVFKQSTGVVAVAYRKRCSKAVFIKRKRRFYFRDAEGYFYIPEIDKPRRPRHNANL